jgi:hypothetical protein
MPGEKGVDHPGWIKNCHWVYVMRSEHLNKPRHPGLVQRFWTNRRNHAPQRAVPAKVQLFRLGEAWLGVPFVVAVAWSLTVATTLRRVDEWDRFRQLRARLPHRLRTHRSSLLYYGRMLFSWHAGHCLSLLYDRLGDPRWARRIVFRGHDPLAGRGRDQPVILAFLHVGATLGSIPLMRSKGYPFIGFVAAEMPFMRKCLEHIVKRGDDHYHLTGIPVAVVGRGRSQVLGISRALKAHGIVAMSMDGFEGPPQFKLPAGGGEIGLHNGAIRLAIAHGALLVPFTVRDSGLLRYEMVCGRPVPQSVLEAGDIEAAARHLVDEIVPLVEGRLGGLHWTAMEAFCDGVRCDRRIWP